MDPPPKKKIECILMTGIQNESKKTKSYTSGTCIYYHT